MIVDDFFERREAHFRRCPAELRDRVGRAFERVVEQDLERTQYISLLADIQRRCTARSASAKTSAPLWVESPRASFSSLLSHLAPLRRDVRHALVSDLIGTDVVRRRRVDGVDDAYVPFRFACTSERERVSLLRDLHHDLAALLPTVGEYVTGARTIERRVLHALRGSEAIAGWNVQRVSLGHAEADSAYSMDPRVSHDHVVFDERGDDAARTVRVRTRVAETSAPQHPLLTRETYESDDRERVHARVVLNVNAYLERSAAGRRERVVASFGYAVFVLDVELSNSPRHAVLLRSPSGVARAVAPLKTVVRTLTPDQWFRYLLADAVPNPALAAVWCVLREVYYPDAATEASSTFEERVRRMDRRIPDVLRPEDVVEMLPSRQREYVLQLRTARRLRLVHMARVRCRVPPGQCLSGRVDRGEVHLARTSAPYMSEGRWVVVTPDGTQWAPRAVATFYLANLVARRTLDCIIASHVVSATGDFHVTYVSGESLHDTFF